MLDRKSILATVVSLALTGCSVGPRYKQPTLVLPQQFTAPNAATADVTPLAEASDPEFWHSFNDPELSSLVQRVLTANNDLRVALAHYDSANALLREAKFDRYPTVTMSSSVGRQKFSAIQAFGYPRNNRFFTPDINASWELDFFGRVRHNIEAQRQRTLADASDLAAMQVTVVGEVASTYIGLRGQQERLRVARENAENELETVRLVEAAYSAGRGTQFDTARARALFETTTSRIPELLSAIALDEHRLAVLSGLPPDALVSELEVASRLPDLPKRIDPGTPADLVRRRPDISASEQRLHAATEQIGVATADLFPRVNFAGILGMNEFHGDTPFDGISAVNLTQLNIDWSFLDRGRVRARIAASRADGDAQLAQYQQSVLLALEDVENALVIYARSQDRDVQLQLAAKDSKRAADLASVRFKNGATGLLDLLDAQRVQLQAEDAYAESHSNSALSAVLLYKSLAGGWPQHLPSPPRGASGSGQP
jgi:NodT family efflux transporter outer membrane factor (OMF) lipoprotein